LPDEVRGPVPGQGMPSLHAWCCLPLSETRDAIHKRMKAESDSFLLGQWCVAKPVSRNSANYELRSVVVKALCYMPKSRGFETSGV
jgi:hypothetical protein